MNRFETSIAELGNMNLEEKYKRYILYTKYDPKIRKYYKQIRFGIKIEFDIYDLICENFSEKAKSGLVLLRKKVPIQTTDLYTEMEERTALIEKGILEAQIDEGELVIKARERKL